MTELLCDYILTTDSSGKNQLCHRLAYRFVSEDNTNEHPRCKRHSRKWKIPDDQRTIRDITKNDLK